MLDGDAEALLGVREPVVLAIVAVAVGVGEDDDAVSLEGRESEPAVAIQDALATFKADRIVVFSHPEGDRDYREDDGIADAEQRFGIPVTHALIER